MEDDTIYIKLTTSADMTMASLVLHSKKAISLSELKEALNEYVKEVTEKVPDTH